MEVEVSLSAICKFVHQSGLTRQKLVTTATQRDEFLREQFISDVSVYNPDLLVFIDETGADRKSPGLAAHQPRKRTQNASRDTLGS